MGVITAGYGAADGNTYINPGLTVIDMVVKTNDGPGELDTFEIWAVTSYPLTGCIVATFEGSSVTWASIDYEIIGNVAAGSKQTFSGLSLHVKAAGNALGVYYASGRCEATTGGVTNNVLKAGDWTDPEDGKQTYAGNTSILRIFASGETGWGNIALVMGVNSADIASILGVSTDDIAALNGVAI